MNEFSKMLSRGFRDFSPKIILDVGGNRYDHDILKSIFPDARIICLNLEFKLKEYEGCDIELIKADAHYLPIKDEIIDMFFATEVFEHLLFPNIFINEVKRASKKKSMLSLTTPNMSCWSNRVLLLFGYSPTNYTPYPSRIFGAPKFIQKRLTTIYDHPRIFTYKGLREIMNQEGFSVTYITGFSYIDIRAIGKFKAARAVINKFLPSGMQDAIFICAMYEKTKK